MFLDRHGQGAFRATLLALLAAGLLPLIVAATASAAFEVDSTGDGAKAAAGAVCETSTPGECTLRAAIEAANAEATKDEIEFGPLFDGGAGAAITLGGPLPEVTSPAQIDGGLCSVSSAEVPCVAIKGVSGFASLAVKANESVVEHLKFEGGSPGIRVQALGAAGPGAEILENTFTGAHTAISSVGTIGGTGNLIEGNTIDVPENFNFGINISNGPNRIFGNTITGDGCCYTGIWLSGTASGNRIGGDTEASENVINGFQNGAITLILPESTRNEVGRNRGENGGPFINLGPESANGGIQPPTVTSALQSSISGVAEPEAKIRVFRKATEWEGEIAGFLGEATADDAGNWTVKYSGPVPVGTDLAATQTDALGGTSELALAVAAADPPPTCNDTPAPPMCVKPPDPPVCPAMPGACGEPVPPRVTITKAPKAKSTKTTAKFVFKSSVAGSTFQCQLDKKAWARCRSPKTYKQLKPAKHVFKLKATAAGKVSPIVTRKFTVLE